MPAKFLTGALRAAGMVALVAALPLLAPSGAAVAADRATAATIEVVRIPARGHRPEYRLEIQGDGSGAASRLVITGPAHTRTVVALEGGLAPVKDALEGSLPGRNALRSKYVFASASLPDGMIMVFGEAMASDPGAIRILQLGGKPSVVTALSDETLKLTDIQDAAGGRGVLLVGWRSFSQMDNDCLSTYDPFAVFMLGAGGRFRYDLALSKAYNLKHYAGWAGPKGREDIAVDTCHTPKRIVPAPPVPQ